MDHKNPRKYRGPETWALVRDAYLAGEPAKLVCARFDVSYANLRAKARREGWTRRAHALAIDRSGVRRAAASSPPAPVPPTVEGPEAAVKAAMDRASEALAAGRAQDASAILKAVEAFDRVNSSREPPPAPEPVKDPEAEEKGLLAYMEAVMDQAYFLAQCMLSDDRAHLGPAWAGRNVYAWRAEHFGPEVARQDFEFARSRRSHKLIWHEDGTLYPPTPKGQVPLHMQSAFDHYGPKRKRRSPPDAVDDL
jgi:hypothetical protein